TGPRSSAGHPGRARAGNWSWPVLLVCIHTNNPSGPNRQEQPPRARSIMLSNRPAYDLETVRRDFPILASRVHGHPLVYLDTAASAQKARAVTEAMTRFIEQDYANVHRGVHSLAERATEAYEGARARVQRFLNARQPGEIVFTSGATAALNLVAGSWGA